MAIRTKQVAARTILAGSALLAVTLVVASRGAVPAAAPVATSGVAPVAAVVATPAPIARPVARVPAPAPTATPVEASYVVKRVLDVPSPMKFGTWFWDEAGVPAGPVVVTVDLEAETISVFRAGYEIGTAVVLYGADVKPTPLGVFAITQKDADHHSNIYGGAPMPYMMRLTNDGVSIHGSDVKAGFMTHGCVGVPTAFAKKLFAQAKLGDTVIVTRGERLDVGGAIKAVKI